jgi:hypothetical protein
MWLAQAGSDIEPLSQLAGYGVIGLMLILTAIGKVWWWPAVREILDRLDRTEKKLDRHQELYESVVIPTLKDAGDAITEVNKLLWTLQQKPPRRSSNAP